MSDRFLHPTEQMEARFRRTYPWRQCDETTRKAFYSWQGKRLNAIGKGSQFSDYEMGLRNVMNGEKTELELEKLTASWEAFQEVQHGKAVAKTIAERSLSQGSTIVQEVVPVVGPQQHLARLKGMWQFPQHHQFVRDRVAANPDWGIVVGADGPHLADG